MAIDELDKLSSLKTRLAKLSPETSHYMYKVPGHLRDVNSKAFEPEMVAIGPYYHGRPELKRMEEMKLRYMQHLLELIPNVTLDDYISAVKEIAEKARDCYSEPFMKLDSAGFIDMLVLDGCFIIGVIDNRDLFVRTFPDRSRFRMLQRDLILLENQIPFFVLCKLYDLNQGPQRHEWLIGNVLMFCEYVFPGKKLYYATRMRRSEEVQHILDLIHSNYCPSKSSDHHTTDSPSNPSYHYTESVPVEGSSDTWIYPTTTSSRNDIIIPSASELKDANVKFRNKDYDSEDKIRLFDVEFDSGKMVMPTLVIDDWTESLLRNFIAYEQLFPNGRPSHVVDYIVLLDRLINTSKDVYILCRAKIIQNFLSSEEAVVDLVNKLGKGIMVDNKIIYTHTFRRINVHHKKCWNRAVTALRRDYFNSPWAYIAFLGALLLFLLTAAQTIFSALQL